MACATASEGHRSPRRRKTFHERRIKTDVARQLAPERDGLAYYLARDGRATLGAKKKNQKQKENSGAERLLEGGLGGEREIRMLKSNRMHSLREGRQATDFMMMFIYFAIFLQSQTSAPTIKFIVVSTTKRDDVSQWVKKKKTSRWYTWSWRLFWA